MIRKVSVLVAVAVVVSFSVVVAVDNRVVARPRATVDAVDYSVSCTHVVGSATLKPPLTASGSNGTEKVSFKATISGCAAVPSGGGPPVVVVRATVKGAFTVTGARSCAALFGTHPAGGSVKAKWTTHPALKRRTSSGSIVGLDASLDSNGRAELLLHGSSPQGPFQGTDNGAGDTIQADSVQSAAELLATCEAGGLKAMGLTDASSGAAVDLS
jgi:hypothetical protein